MHDTTERVASFVDRAPHKINLPASIQIMANLAGMWVRKTDGLRGAAADDDDTGKLQRQQLEKAAATGGKVASSSPTSMLMRIS